MPCKPIVHGVNCCLWLVQERLLNLKRKTEQRRKIALETNNKDVFMTLPGPREASGAVWPGLGCMFAQDQRKHSPGYMPVRRGLEDANSVFRTHVQMLVKRNYYYEGYSCQYL